MQWVRFYQRVAKGSTILQFHLTSFQTGRVKGGKGGNWGLSDPAGLGALFSLFRGWGSLTGRRAGGGRRDPNPTALRGAPAFTTAGSGTAAQPAPRGRFFLQALLPPGLPPTPARRDRAAPAPPGRHPPPAQRNHLLRAGFSAKGSQTTGRPISAPPSGAERAAPSAFRRKRKWLRKWKGGPEKARYP